jgi:hypothetical protein
MMPTVLAQSLRISKHEQLKNLAEDSWEQSMDKTLEANLNLGSKSFGFLTQNN